MLRLFAVAALALALTTACAADDESIEKKKCDIGAVDKEQQCIKDYHCECEGPSCFCVPDQQSLQQAVAAEPADVDDPSGAFLQRLYRLELP